MKKIQSCSKLRNSQNRFKGLKFTPVVEFIKSDKFPQPNWLSLSNSTFRAANEILYSWQSWYLGMCCTYLLDTYLISFLQFLIFYMAKSVFKRFFKYKGFSDISQIFISAKKHAKSFVNTIFFLVSRFLAKVLP